MDVVIYLEAFDDNIVDVNLEVAADLWVEGLLHQPLECCPCVTQAKGHGCITKGSEWRDECGLLLIFPCERYLMIA